MELKHKKAVLTGAASGIGLALMNLLADFPLDLLAVDLDRKGLESACMKVCSGSRPARIVPFICDLSTAKNVDRLFERAISTLGEINLFVANSGFAYYELIEKPDWERIQNIYRCNVFNTLYTAEKMAALYGDKTYKIVITASAMAHIAVPGYAIYSSTKAALDRFVDGYRWQLDDPRKIMLVYPIATRTGFFKTAGDRVPIPWPSQTAEAVARAILRGIQKDRLCVYPSTMFRIIMFLDRFLPMHNLVQRIEQGRFKSWLRIRG